MKTKDTKLEFEVDFPLILLILELYTSGIVFFVKKTFESFLFFFEKIEETKKNMHIFCVLLNAV